MKDLFEKIAKDAALKSGIFIKGSVGKIAHISYKGIDNIVTDIDKKAESIIIKSIVSKFPDHSILSEESQPRIGSSPYKWVIDPLDGTTNFAHSFPFFCVSIALELKGVLQLGVVYDPMRNELFFARKGGGAYLNRKKIRVSKVRRLSDSFLATGFAYGKKTKDENVELFRRFLTATLAIRRAGSAALDLCYVACGRFDGYWEKYLHPWDSAAGTLIVREAGGVVVRFDGSDYSHYDRDILASNGRNAEAMTCLIEKK